MKDLRIIEAGLQGVKPWACIQNMIFLDLHYFFILDELLIINMKSKISPNVDTVIPCITKTPLKLIFLFD